MGTRVNLFGIDIDNLTFEEALEKIIGIVESNHKGYVVTANVDHIVRLQDEPDFRKAYAGALLVLADGMPIVMSSRLLGVPLKSRITGADLFPAICRVASERGFKIFLLGGLPGVAEKAAQKLKTMYPSIKFVGIYSPPFGFEKSDTESEKIRRMINDVAPDILFIGVGAPKQEMWIHKHIEELNIKVALCVGGAFDFVAGKVRRAPKILQKLALEWFWRLIHEPKRLWRRYILYDTRFFSLFLKEFRNKKIGGHKKCVD